MTKYNNGLPTYIRHARRSLEVDLALSYNGTSQVAVVSSPTNPYVDNMWKTVNPIDVLHRFLTKDLVF